MNKITLIGNLTRDPELRTTNSGTSVCTFGIAVNRRRANANGERQTDFFRINVWGRQADSCQRYLAKGRKVAVVGELQASTYTGNDGTTRLSLDVSADEVEFLSSREDSNGSQGNYQGSYQSGRSSGGNQNGGVDTTGFTDIASDDIPF